MKLGATEAVLMDSNARHNADDPRRCIGTVRNCVNGGPSVCAVGFWATYARHSFAEWSSSNRWTTTSARFSLSRKFGHFLGFNGDLSANCSLATINIPILDIIGDRPTIDYFEIFIRIVKFWKFVRWTKNQNVYVDLKS